MYLLSPRWNKKYKTWKTLRLKKLNDFRTKNISQVFDDHVQVGGGWEDSGNHKGQKSVEMCTVDNVVSGFSHN